MARAPQPGGAAVLSFVTRLPPSSLSMTASPMPTPPVPAPGDELASELLTYTPSHGPPQYFDQAVADRAVGVMVQPLLRAVRTGAVALSRVYPALPPAWVQGARNAGPGCHGHYGAGPFTLLGEYRLPAPTHALSGRWVVALLLQASNGMLYEYAEEVPAFWRLESVTALGAFFAGVPVQARNRRRLVAYGRGAHTTALFGALARAAGRVAAVAERDRLNARILAAGVPAAMLALAQGGGLRGTSREMSAELEAALRRLVGAPGTESATSRGRCRASQYAGILQQLSRRADGRAHDPSDARELRQRVARSMDGVRRLVRAMDAAGDDSPPPGRPLAVPRS